MSGLYILWHIVRRTATYVVHGYGGYSEIEIDAWIDRLILWLRMIIEVDAIATLLCVAVATIVLH